MLDILKEKILSWTPEKADAFYKGLLRFQPESARIWEIEETGFYLYSGNYASYSDNNGTIFTLEVGDLSENLNTKKALSNLADQLGSIKIEKPTVIDVISIFGTPFTYSETVRPYNSLGLDFSNLKNTDDLKSTVLKFITYFLVATEDLIRLIDTYTGDTSVMKYPHSAESTTLPFNLFFDPVTSNYFWAGSLRFYHSRADTLSALTQDLGNIENIFREMYGKDIAMRSDIIDIMREKCTIIQLP